MIRFSSACEMPTPLRLPIAFASCIASSGVTFLPLIETQRLLEAEHLLDRGGRLRRPHAHLRVDDEHRRLDRLEVLRLVEALVGQYFFAGLMNASISTLPR